MMEQIVHAAERWQETYTALRRELHRSAETAYHEEFTAQRVQSELLDCGLDVTRKGTCVMAVLHGALPGKTLILRADMDALPMEEKTGLPFASSDSRACHACGHDIHMAALLFAARLLSEQRSRLSGTVKFLFQPAEETLTGAQFVLQSNPFFDGADAIFAAHTWPALPVGNIGIRQGPMMASADTFEIQIHAQGGHAAHPEQTADPVLIASETVSHLHLMMSRELSPLDRAVLTVGELHAGTAPNIIPSEAVLRGTVRTLSEPVRARLQERILQIAQATAHCFCAEAEVRYHRGCPPLVCSHELTELVRTAAQRVVGESNVVDLPEPSLGSEDFSFYLEKLPGVLFRLGTGDSRPESRLGLHHPKLVFHEQSIQVGALTLCSIVLEFTQSEPFS